MPTNANLSPKSFINDRAMVNWPPGGNESKSEPSINTAAGTGILILEQFAEKWYLDAGNYLI